MKTDWSNDWQKFVAQLAEMLNGGTLEEQISERFRGSKVQWKGRVVSIDLDREYIPGIDLSMGDTELPLANGRVLRTDHVPLHIEPHENETWLGCEVGELVEFSATIPVEGPTSTELYFDEYDDEPLVDLMITLYSCRRVVNSDSILDEDEATIEPSESAENRITDDGLVDDKHVGGDRTGKPLVNKANAIATAKDKSNEITEIITEIRALCLHALDEGKYTHEHDKVLYDLCGILSKNPNYRIWAPLLYELVEEFDADVDLTLGSPGPLVHALENTDKKQIREFLVESLVRKPTGLVTGMATYYAVGSNEDREIWNKILKDVLEHPNSDFGAIEIANDVLDTDWN